MNLKYFIIALCLFLVEVFIALVVKDSFIRPFLGDLLVVILIYFCVRTFAKWSPLNVAFGTFIFAASVETSQYFKLSDHLGLQEGTVGEVILGSTFDWLDLLVYALGCAIAFFVDSRFLIERNTNEIEM